MTRADAIDTAASAAVDPVVRAVLAQFVGVDPSTIGEAVFHAVLGALAQAIPGNAPVQATVDRIERVDERPE